MNSIGNSFGNLMAGSKPIIQNGDPWSGMRTVGQQAPMTGNQNLQHIFGSMQNMQQPSQSPQFSPVQVGGNQSGSDLSQLVMAILKSGNGQ